MWVLTPTMREAVGVIHRHILEFVHPVQITYVLRFWGSERTSNIAQVVLGMSCNHLMLVCM